MAMDLLMETMVMVEDINRMAKDTEVDMEVTEATSSEATVVMSTINLEAMAVTVATNSEVMVVTEVTDMEAMAVTEVTSLEGTEAISPEVVMATLIPILPQTKMNTSQKLVFLKSFFNH